MVESHLDVMKNRDVQFRVSILILLMILLSSPFLRGKEGKPLASLREEFAARYRKSAEAYEEKGWLPGVAKAWEGILELNPEDLAAQQALEEVRTRMIHHPPPRTSLAPPETPEIRAIFNGQNLKGLKKVEGDFIVERGALRGTGNERNCILSTLRPPSDTFEILCSLMGKGSSYGLIFTSQKGSLIALHFQGSDVSLYNLKKEESLLKLEAKLAGDWRDIRIEVLQNRALFHLGGKLLGKWDFDSPPRGPVGVYGTGSFSLRSLGCKPSAARIFCEHACRLIERDFLEEGLEFLERAVKESPGYMEAYYHLGALRDRLFQREEALEAYRRFLGESEGWKNPSLRVNRFLRRGQSRMEELEAFEKDLGEIRRSYVARLREAGKESFLSGKGELARKVLEELSRLGALDRLSEKFLTLLKFQEGAQDGWYALFNGEDLAGWEIVEKEWHVEDGILKGMGDFDHQPRIFPLPVPYYPRALFELKFYTEKLVHFGLLLGKKEGGMRLHIKNVFGDNFIQAVRDDGSNESELHRPFRGDPPRSKEWHTLSLLCDYNRIFIMLNGVPQASRVFDRDLLSPPGLFVEPQNEMHFKDVRFRLLGDEKAFRETLSRFGASPETVAECERTTLPFEAKGGKSDSFLCHAYNGTVLGDWGNDPGHFLRTSLELTSYDCAFLHVRYSLAEKERRVKASFDNGEERALSLTPTGDPNEFSYATLPLGEVKEGFHDLLITSGESADPLNLDRLVVNGSPEPPWEINTRITSEKAPHFVIRSSPRVEITIQPKRIFPLVEAVHEFLTDYFGYAPDEKLTLQIISRECWIDRHAGGYASGHNLFIPEEGIYNDIELIIHEMSHCFESGVGHNPPWFAEGKSFPAILDFIEEKGGEFREHISTDSLGRARDGRLSIKELDDPQGNLLQFWGTEKFPYKDLQRRLKGYEGGSYICTEMRKMCGRHWLKNYCDLIRRDMEEGEFYMPASDVVLANNVIIDYLSRGNGVNLRPHFQEWGFTIVDIYSEEEGHRADCGKAPEPYLTDGGVSRRGPWEGEEKARFLEEGSMIYVFPVKKDVPRVEVEFLAEGFLRVQSAAKTLIETGKEEKKKSGTGKKKEGEEEKGKPRGRIYSVVLSEPSSWENCRLSLRFEALERGEGKGKKKIEDEKAKRGGAVAWIQVKFPRGEGAEGKGRALQR